jgi:hypothetical protein
LGYLSASLACVARFMVVGGDRCCLLGVRWLLFCGFLFRWLPWVNDVRPGHPRLQPSPNGVVVRWRCIVGKVYVRSAGPRRCVCGCCRY